MAKHIGPICKGAGIGLLIAAAALASGDSPNLAWARAFDILGAPVSLLTLVLQKVFRLSDPSSAGLWLLFHFIYWMLIGGLVGWGVGALRSNVIGDE